MKLRRAFALAVTATALCGLAASSASAEEAPPLTGPLTACAYVRGEPPLTVVGDPRCVTITVSDEKSWNEYVVFEECLEGATGWVDSQALEQQEEALHGCQSIAASANSTAHADKRHQRKHRHHRARHAHRRTHRS